MPQILGGEWRFRKAISKQELAVVANEFATGEKGDRFVSLYVRPASESEHYLGFKYLLEDGEKRTEKKVVMWMRAVFRLRFGNNLCRWSISPITIIKQAAVDIK